MLKQILVYLITSILLMQHLVAQTDSIPPRKEYFTARASKTPKIDGLLDDITWENVPVISDFKQNFPINGAACTQRTEVKIVYDNTAIYVAAMLYDSAPDSIARQLGNRDDNLNADNFRIVFDTYNTEQDAFDLTVTASGVQLDSRFSDGLYNAVWESAVKMNNNGWSCEIKIPFSALRFPNQSVQLWGMQITRNITRNGEFDQWGLLPKGVSNPFKYWGFLKGMENIKQPIRLSLTPYITAYTSHYPSNLPGQSNYTSNITGGLDLKYGLNESFTVDATLLPDFTQVQSDNVVKNLSAFQVQYAEQRPFFQESTDLFQKGNLFYSRRIGRQPTGYYNAYSQTADKETIIQNPSQAKLLNATKVSGRTPNGLGIGIMNAVLDNTYAIARDSLGHDRKILTEPFSNYNIIVFDQQMKNGSSVHLINTNVNRTHGYGNANVTGAGFNLNNKKNTYSITFEGATSNVLSKIDSVPNQFTDLFGYKYGASLNKTSGKFQFSLYRNSINQTFNNNAMGITNQTNYINEGLFLQLFQFKPRGRVLTSDEYASIDYNENFTTHTRNGINLNAGYNMTFKDYEGININVSMEPKEGIDYYEARTPGRIFIRTPNYYGNFNYNSDQRKKISVSLGMYCGSTYFISKTIGYNPFYGASISPNLRLNDKLSFNLYSSVHIDDGDRGWVDSDYYGNIIFGVRKLTTVENIASAKYLFRNNLSLSIRVRHYWDEGHYKSFHNLEEDGHLTDNVSYDINHDFSFNAFNVDMVFQWQFAPGSSLNLVWKNTINQEDEKTVPTYTDAFNRTVNSKQLNTVSLKVLYYFDYLYLRKKENKQ